MPTSPNNISPLPTPPSSSDPGSFDSRADAFLSSLPTFQSQANSLGSNVYNNAVEANTSATNAANSATNANGSASNAANSASASSASASSASTSATNAANSATNANTARQAAEAARDQALAAGGDLLVGTSANSLTMSGGNKSLTTQTNKSFVPGQYLILYRTSNSSIFMQGIVNSYDKSNGSLSINVDYISQNTGSFSDWGIGVIGRRGESAERPLVLISSDTVAVAGNDYAFISNCKLTMPTAVQYNDTFGITNASNASGPTIDFGNSPVKTQIVGVVTMLNPNDSCVVKWSNNPSIGYVQIG